MIRYSCFQFATPPLTGGSWFVRAAQLAGLGLAWPIHAVEPFSESNDGTTLRVSLARHPLDWLEQCYDAMKHNGVKRPRLRRFTELRLDSPGDFLRDYLDKLPGSISELYDEYRADTVLRIEDMPWALTELLEGLGIDPVLRDNATRMAVPTGEWKNAEVDPGLRRSLMNAERKISDAYDYF